MRAIGRTVWVVFMTGVRICGVWDGLLTREITRVVNDRLPKDEQFPVLFGNHRYFEVRRESRRQFPNDLGWIRVAGRGRGWSCKRLKYIAVTYATISFAFSSQ